MRQTNEEYSRILAETEQLLNKKIQKHRQSQKNQTKIFLENFKENLKRDKLRFTQMRKENEESRKVRLKKN